MTYITAMMSKVLVLSRTMFVLCLIFVDYTVFVFVPGWSISGD